MPEEVLNRETFNRLYTGGTQEQLSGLVHLDARHYSPAKTKFVQPDPYSLTELSLPEEARHTLVKAAGLTLEGLLADPAQQLSNSYVSNNPLRWVDPLGLCKVTYENDEAGKPDPNPRDLTPETRRMVEDVARRTGLNLNVNSGLRNPRSKKDKSRHTTGQAADINRINEIRVDSPRNRENVRTVQEEFNRHPNIRENFGPTLNTKTENGRVRDFSEVPGISGGHQDHSHVSGQR